MFFDPPPAPDYLATLQSVLLTRLFEQVCERTGDLLLCEGHCYAAFHPECISLSAPPKGKFLCGECSTGERCVLPLEPAGRQKAPPPPKHFAKSVSLLENLKTFNFPCRHPPLFCVQDVRRRGEALHDTAVREVLPHQLRSDLLGHAAAKQGLPLPATRVSVLSHQQPPQQQLQRYSRLSARHVVSTLVRPLERSYLSAPKFQE